ncbi:solute carrier family 15 member 2-like [Brevipalpus obovatus]|uniref:solute carrier family 15 member 2-like n=1 Tax=Brevipalpus obovatus TaxID=246614 RepID=UPI003D9F1BA7
MGSSAMNNNKNPVDSNGINGNGIHHRSVTPPPPPTTATSTTMSAKDPERATSDDNNDKPLKYPKSVFFIIGNEFCERFSYYGMKAVLVIYFTRVLTLTEDEATKWYHEFIMLCYFTPALGAILADSFLGKFHTILWLSILYALGNIFLSYASYVENSTFSLISLAMVAFGTGGIKPCVSAFGGDQFVAGQEKRLQQFFAVFYMSINLGSLISTFLTPILRGDISCSERGDCFPLAFGVPAALMTVATALFIAGKSSYRIVEVAKGNVIFQYFHCNFYAFGLRIKSLFNSSDVKHREHWLDHADTKFTSNLIRDVKCVNRVLFLYIPLPLFWALFDQQGSRWTLQAQRMDGTLWSGFELKPDQMQVINPVLIVLMIPVFEYVIYPTLSKFGLLTRPLQRMTFGGLLAALSFVFAAFLQISIDSSSEKVSMMWQIAPYAVITCGEVMFSITGLEFSYSQAPTSMKSVVQAAWLSTVSFGSFLVVIVTKYIKFSRQSDEFFLFAALMTLDMVVFSVMAYLYVYSDQSLDDVNAQNHIMDPLAAGPEAVHQIADENKNITGDSGQQDHVQEDTRV